MERSNLLRTVLLSLACAAWAFLLVAFGSFRPTDWPSHAVAIHPPTQNLCGPAGAYVAYHAYLALGQGVFPLLFFAGVVLVLFACKANVGDWWMRAVGLLLLAAAFAAAVHHFSPGAADGLPEGRGGVVGIATASFFQQYFSTIGTRLVLLTMFLVGLLLAADDLVLRAPAAMTAAVVTVRNRAPQIKWNFAPLPKLPSLPGFVTRDALAAKPPARKPTLADAMARSRVSVSAGEPTESPMARLAAFFGRRTAGASAAPSGNGTTTAGSRGPVGKIKPSAQVAAAAVVATLNNGDDEDDDDRLDLSYPEDEHAGAAADAAFIDDGDFGPSEAAVIPPKDQQAPVRPPPVFNRAAVAPATGPAAPAQQAAAPAARPVPIIRTAAPAPAPVAPPAAAPVASAANLDDEDDTHDFIPPPSAAIPSAPPPTEALAAGDGSETAPEVRKDIVVKLPNMMKPRQSAPPPAPPRELGEYQLPGWEHLEDAENGYAESQETFVREQAAMLEQTLKEFGIDAHVVEIDTGPVITMFEISLAPGIKVSTIAGLSNDIQRSLRAETVRIVAPIPGKNTVGIEVPNEQKEKVRFKDLMQLAPESASKMDIPLFLGKDASGEPLITDLAKMPHALIAGTTGSGKSVCINTIIMSILYKQRPDLVKLVLFDPKVVEMAMYKDIPHLMCPVINDASKATSVLEWACEKMDERYEFLAEAGVRNIKGYNTLTQDELFERFQPSTPEEEAKIPKKLPYMVIIIDELADLMMTSGKEVEAHIVRIAQKARAVGIHLILATQRPSANVVTGLIKANMPTRIAFRVQSKMDSRIVLDQNGAECLLGHGDMLFLPPGASKPTRSQGTFIDDKEVRDTVKLVKSMAEAQYEPELVQIKSSLSAEDMEKDELFEDAVKCVLETKRGSVSLLQRRLTIGYSRASRLIEAMAQAGILGDYKGSQARECNITLEDWEQMKAAQQADADGGMTV